MTPHCPLHGPMSLDERLDAGAESWLCRAWPACRETVARGGVDERDVWRRETPGPSRSRVRTVDEQFASGWRGVA